MGTKTDNTQQHTHTHFPLLTLTVVSHLVQPALEGVEVRCDPVLRPLLVFFLLVVETLNRCCAGGRRALYFSVHVLYVVLFGNVDVIVGYLHILTV